MSDEPIKYADFMNASLLMWRGAAMNEMAALDETASRSIRAYIDHLERTLQDVEQRHDAFLDETWALVNFRGEWEYPAQILRYLTDDIEGYKKAIASYKASQQAVESHAE